MLIDDEQHIADVVLYFLKEHGFTALHASTGEQGLKWVRERNPDLVLLDLNLPVLSGLDVFRELKRLRPDLPVIMLTCRGEEVDRVLGLEMGADDYVTKPFSARELVARVKAVLRRPVAPEVAARLRIGPLECDPAAFTLTCHGVHVPLTRAELELMKALMAHPARIFSRDDLLRRMYGEGHPVTDRTIDAHVKRLRRKLQAALPGPDPILTVYGIGYKINPDLEHGAE